MQENISLLLTKSRTLSYDLTQRPDEDSLQGTGRRRHPAEVLEPDVHHVGVCGRCRDLSAWISTRFPFSVGTSEPSAALNAAVAIHGNRQGLEDGLQVLIR